MSKVSSKLKKKYSDAIIVGGGLVGATVAHSLAFSGLLFMFRDNLDTIFNPISTSIHFLLRKLIRGGMH